MRALVTGGAGFIGSHLVDGLLKKDFEVTVLDNLSTGKRFNLPSGIRFIQGDICDESTLNNAMEGIDYVFHLAASVSVQESIKYPLKTEHINSMGTLIVLEAARKNNVKKLIFSSSAAIYGDNDIPNIESQESRALSPYAITKSMGEYYCKVYSGIHGLDTVSLRYFNVYGPRQDPTSPYSGVISIFVDRLKNNQPPIIYGDGKQTRDFIYVEDVVRANIMSMKIKTMGETINIATSKQRSINELTAEINRILNKDIRSIHEDARPGDIAFSYADVAKAKKVLGFQALCTFSDSLRKTIS